MLIHGTGDDNGHYQHAEALVNELGKNNLLFSFIVYPNRSHGLWEGKNTKLHVYNTMTNYFLRNLEPGVKLKNYEKRMVCIVNMLSNNTCFFSKEISFWDYC